MSMPSRAYTSFLLWRIGKESFIHISVSVNALSSLYLISTLHLLSGSEIISFGVNALSGLYLISTKGKKGARNGLRISVNALSGLYLISTAVKAAVAWLQTVSMPSRAYTSFLQPIAFFDIECFPKCQCPLGLIPHFYDKMWLDESNWKIACQCPLGLIPHFYT